MPRPTMYVDKTKLVREIKKVEANGPLPTMDALYREVAKSEWARGHGKAGLSPGVIGLRIRQFNIKTVTKPGKKGRISGQPGGKRTKRSDKWAADPQVRKSLRLVRGQFEESPRTESLLQKFEAGSMKAAIGLNCIDCCGGQQEEVKKCEIQSCPLWVFRPWKENTVLKGVAA